MQMVDLLVVNKNDGDLKQACRHTAAEYRRGLQLRHAKVRSCWTTRDVSPKRFVEPVSTAALPRFVSFRLRGGNLLCCGARRCVKKPLQRCATQKTTSSQAIVPAP